MRRRMTVFASLVSIVGLVLMQSPASASHGDISVPLNTFVAADEGEVVQLVSVPVDAELVGATCGWEFHATNQESVHPGNDLILSTGGTDTVVPGVEDAPGQVLDVTGSFELGETLTVSLRMGPDEVFSAGLSVEVLCEGHDVPATATTTPATATTTPATATTTPATATTAPVPTIAAPAPTTTEPVVDTEVAGDVETVEPAAPATSAAPTSAASSSAAAASALAVTGPSSSTGPLVGLAMLLLFSGLGVLRLGTRSRG